MIRKYMSKCFLLCRECGKVIILLRLAEAFKRTNGVCVSCFHKFLLTKEKTISTICFDCGIKFEYVYKGRKPRLFCDECSEGASRNRRWKKNHYEFLPSCLTKLGTLDISKRSDDFNIEEKRVKTMKRLWLKPNKQHSYFITISNEDHYTEAIEDFVFYQETHEESNWFWDSKAWDFVTECVLTWLYMSKPE